MAGGNTQVELFPRLDACIETQAKRRFEEISQRLIKGEEGDLAGELEVLRLFLEKEDFNRLRGESEPHLAAGKTVKFVVGREGGRPVYRMETT